MVLHIMSIDILFSMVAEEIHLSVLAVPWSWFKPEIAHLVYRINGVRGRCDRDNNGVYPLHTIRSSGETITHGMRVGQTESEKSLCCYYYYYYCIVTILCTYNNTRHSHSTSVGLPVVYNILFHLGRYKACIIIVVVVE